MLLLTTTSAALLLFAAGCGNSSNKAAAPPRPGTLAYDWYASNEAWKAGDYPRAMEHLSRLSVAQSEYRDRAKLWLLVTAGGIAQGYNELADAYAANSRANLDFRRKATEVRNSANVAAMQFAETLHDMLGKNKDPKFVFDFGFPSGSADLPLQMGKIGKGMAMQAADHQVVRLKMAQRGVVRFAAALAGSPDELAKAQEQFAAANRDTVLKATAKNLVAVADLYSQKKLDIPKRGNALVQEAVEALSLLPDSKEKKDLDAAAKDALKKYKIQS